MFLVLTYHRIVDDAKKLENFFDVTADEFEAQIRLAKELWGCTSLSPSAFLDPQSHPADRRIGLIITFDDGTADHYSTAAPILERNGLHGVFFVSTNLIGAEGYMNAEQCRELHSRGHAIESHSHDHKKLHKLSREDVRFQLSESRRILSELGMGSSGIHAMPGGYYNDTVVEEAKVAGYSFLRTINWGYNRYPSPFGIESVMVNRKTAGRFFKHLISPRFEGAKKLFYKSKDFAKNGPLKSLYFGIRDLGFGAKKAEGK